jgi:putative nucleotidyltransferase with HDIG domain
MPGDDSPNHWLALVEGQPAATGPTAADAERAARDLWPDHPLALSYVERSDDNALQLSPLLAELRPLLDRRPFPVYLVGGAVRDALLGRISHDLDFAVPQGGVELAFAIGDALRVPAYVLDDTRDVGRVILSDWGTTLDIARFRGPDLTADLAGRDFTINALALPATARDAGSVIDLVGGQADLAAEVIRAVHSDSIRHDPVRALRGVRQALQFGFMLAPETEAALTAAAPLLGQPSPERIRDELVNLLAGDHPDRALLWLARLGLLAPVLPEVAAMAGVAQSPPHHEPVLEHTAAVLRWLVLIERLVAGEIAGGDPPLADVSSVLAPYGDELQTHWGRTVEGGLDGRTLLRFGALFHDTGKPQTRSVEAERVRFLGHDTAGAALASRRLKALAFSNEAAGHVSTIVAGHMRPLLLATGEGLPSRRAVYRFYRATGAAGLDIAVLALADHLATYDGRGDEAAWADLLEVTRTLLAGYFTAYETIVQPPRLLTGSELIAALGLVPGPEVGRLLREIEEAQAAGQIDDRESALALARQLHTGS